MRALTAGVLAALLLAGGSAGAQTADELNKARTMFREGVALSAANNWAGALAKFKQVAQVKMNAQVAFNIAECEEHLGKLTSALGNYRLAQSEAASSNAKDVAAQVDGRISALEERIPKLTIKRGEGAETATIELDGVELGSTQIGTAIQVDPGPHVVVAKVDGKEKARETANVPEKETKAVTIVIDADMEKPSDATPKPSDDGKPADTTPAPDQGGSIVPGAAIAGVGVASAAVGVVFMVMRGGTLSDLDTLCGGDNTCPPSAQDTADKGKLYTGLAEVTLALGAVGIATGIVLMVTSGPKKTEAPAAAPEPAAKRPDPRLRFDAAGPGADVGGVSLLGRF